MQRNLTRVSLSVVLLVGMAAGVSSAGAPDLVIAANGQTDAVVVVSPEAGLPEGKGPDGKPARGRNPKATRNDEWLAANDLATSIGVMTGATPRIASEPAEIAAALAGSGPVFLVGEKALEASPKFAVRVRGAAKKNPYLWAEAIGAVREGNRILLAGTTDWSHAHAVSTLLHAWGCRWYFPTAFGECIPDRPRLTVGDLDVVYAPPFEVRHFWFAWRGSNEGGDDFRRRNFLSPRTPVPTSHALAGWVKDLVPPGKSLFNVPIAEEATIRHVAEKVAPLYAAGKDTSLAMDDGIYSSDSPLDRELKALRYDHNFMGPSMTDAFMTLYNGVAKILRERFPESRARIGFLAYSNMTLPPVRVTKAEPSLMASLAPIDFDPIHGMDDPQSPARQEYRDIVYEWARVMEGRIMVRDYDQSMLVWRDIPNPSIQTLAADFGHYRRAGILGVDTETRNAIATVFLNLHCRAQLLWNPDRGLDALLAEFYPAFYGPAAEPMSRYWTAIFDAWRDTIVTEHEYFVAPAIYTPAVLAEMQRHIAAAEALVAPLRAKPNPDRHERQFLERMAFTRASFDVTDAYLGMVRAAATDCDYARAVAQGDRGLAARERMADMNSTFTTYRREGSEIGMIEKGARWWPGEVDQYRAIRELVSGSAGTLIRPLPLEWAFRRDPENVGLKKQWAAQPPDLTFWNEKGAEITPDSRKDVPPGVWEVVRTDLYLQAQGVRTPDRRGFSGHGWYAAEIDLSAQEAVGPVRLMFPGVFNECWLYLAGTEVAHRGDYPDMWWQSDYKFEWDVDLTGKLRPGKNLVVLRIHNPHHYGGMFRRPFLYRPITK